MFVSGHLFFLLTGKHRTPSYSLTDVSKLPTRQGRFRWMTPPSNVPISEVYRRIPQGVPLLDYNTTSSSSTGMTYVPVTQLVDRVRRLRTPTTFSPITNRTRARRQLLNDML